MAIHHVTQTDRDEDANVYRGHLPPPFFNAKDEVHRIEHPSEARTGVRRDLPEDRSNYGTGGYYGNTYRQEEYSRQRWLMENGPGGRRDSYRNVGDRRWMTDPPQRAWDRESFSRHGYRSLEDRIETSGLHRGKGPRSYRRSDARILEDLNDRLYDDPYLNATDIETDVRDGEIILSGTVEDRQSKRRAEDLAETVPGVRNVENRLRVTT